MNAAPLRIEALTGEALAEALPDLARLRIAVFRAWPYLYEGDPEYERNYIRAYAESPGALVVGAFDGDRIVGASTAAPMEDHAAEFAAPFQAHGYTLGDILYCGESVLLPDYRGRGAGHAFFDAREAHGRALGRRLICFCGVVRDPSDPRRPPDYAPLDPFWRKRGYEKVEGLTAEYRWREIGAAEESAHVMQFWLRAL
jgi:GNAT superfamily N-acetyltransferase